MQEVITHRPIKTTIYEVLALVGGVLPPDCLESREYHANLVRQLVGRTSIYGGIYENIRAQCVAAIAEAYPMFAQVQPTVDSETGITTAPDPDDIYAWFTNHAFVLDLTHGDTPWTTDGGGMIYSVFPAGRSPDISRAV